MEIKTTLTADLEQGGPMTGNEFYPIIGNIFDSTCARIITADLLHKFKGLPLFGGCNEKARLAHSRLAPTEIVAGSITIYNGDWTATYGHAYNPPFEQHFWLQYNQNPDLIIDFGLPGVILRGLHEKDEQGPFLLGREPFILLGEAPYWVEYKAQVKIKFI